MKRIRIHHAAGGNCTLSSLMSYEDRLRLQRSMKKRSLTFQCKGCKKRCCWCNGAADQRPNHCDNCFDRVTRRAVTMPKYVRISLTRGELKVLSKLLKMAAEEVVHCSCNEFDVKDITTKLERGLIADKHKDMHPDDRGIYVESGVFDDFLLMRSYADFFEKSIKTKRKMR